VRVIVVAPALGGVRVSARIVQLKSSDGFQTVLENIDIAEGLAVCITGMIDKA
jgi:hypothetical protein